MYQNEYLRSVTYFQKDYVLRLKLNFVYRNKNITLKQAFKWKTIKLKIKSLPLLDVSLPMLYGSVLYQ